MVLDAVRTEALLHDLRWDLHGELTIVRAGAVAGMADFLPHPAGPGRGSAATDLAGDRGGELPAGKTGLRHGVLWNGRGSGAGDRADAGRLDHGQLHVALDLSDQHSGRYSVDSTDDDSDLRSAAPGSGD